MLRGGWAGAGYACLYLPWHDRVVGNRSKIYFVLAIDPPIQSKEGPINYDVGSKSATLQCCAVL